MFEGQEGSLRFDRCLRHLACPEPRLGNRLNLLRDLYAEIVIPPPVAQELERNGVQMEAAVGQGCYSAGSR